MAYFETKKGSLEEAIKSAVKNEKLDKVNPKAVKKKFDDRKDKDIDNDGDVDASDKYLHKRRKAVSKAISKEELDKEDEPKLKKIVKKLKKASDAHAGQASDLEKAMSESKMKELSMKIDDVVSRMKKNKLLKPFADKFKKDAMKSMNIRKSLEKVIPDYTAGAPETVIKALMTGGSLGAMETFEYGTPEATKNSLNMTPGQSTEDWDKQVGIMQEKQVSMRETLAKMWGVEEGHNPFKKDIDERFTRLKSADLAKARKKAGMPPFKKGGYTSAELKKFYDDQKKNKKEDKTMTGKPMTKIDVNPDMKEKKNT